jgi:hypothetical protein
LLYQSAVAEPSNTTGDFTAPSTLSETLLQPTDMRDINNFPREECRYENKMVGVLQAVDDVRIITYLVLLLVATSDQGAKEVLVN